jgi:hypothetical protein
VTTTLPSLTRTIDNAFVTTWYDIKTEATDNILNATVVWAAMNQAGCIKPQVGSDLITRTIRYGQGTATEIQKGDTLPQGDPELETMAIWKWRTIASGVERDIFDDQKNNGPSKIKDLVATKLDAARQALVQKYESSMFNVAATAETGKLFQGLNDLVPLVADRTTGTYGGIARPSSYSTSSVGTVAVPTGTNAWWGPKYLAGALTTLEDDLLSDMKKLYNSVHNNQVPPNLIVTDQNIFETYEEFALDISQIIKDDTTRLADLGFEVLRFKGKPLVWTPNITANNMLFLNLDFIDIMYDPSYWFDMTDFKPVPLETKRIAHILCFANMVSDQLRRHGRLYYA